MRTAVAGSTGFIGRALVPALQAAGHEVVPLSRTTGTDVTDADSLRTGLRGCDVLVYLVHSLDKEDFRSIDAAAARTVCQVAAEVGLQQIVYLSGLGDDADELSDHLSSRHEVEDLLAAGPTPVTVMRAGIVLGRGGASWEILRQLVTRLPVMITPRWVRTRCQPVSLPDVIGWMVGVIDHPGAVGRTFDMGGPEVLRYDQMLTRLAKLMNRPLVVAPVPLLSPRLSSRWLSFITDVDPQTARSLVDSMTNEVVVRDGAALQKVLPRDCLTFEEAARAALA
jgi:uncharacterized protein YbjT (DUF2867 family)